MPRCVDQGTHTGCMFHYSNGQDTKALRWPEDVCRRWPPQIIVDIHHRGDMARGFFPPCPGSQWCGEWIKNGD
jgi:hypothetical protein